MKFKSRFKARLRQAFMRRPNVLNLPMLEQYRAMITSEGARWVTDKDSQR